MRLKTPFGVTMKKEILGSLGVLEDVVTSGGDQKAEGKEVVKEEEVALNFVRREKEKARKEGKGVLTPQMKRHSRPGMMAGMPSQSGILVGKNLLPILQKNGR